MAPRLDGAGAQPARSCQRSMLLTDRLQCQGALRVTRFVDHTLYVDHRGASGAPSDPCRGASSRERSVDRMRPIGRTEYCSATAIHCSARLPSPQRRTRLSSAATNSARCTTGHHGFCARRSGNGLAWCRPWLSRGRRGPTRRSWSRRPSRRLGHLPTCDATCCRESVAHQLRCVGDDAFLLSPGFGAGRRPVPQVDGPRLAERTARSETHRRRK